MEIIGRPYQFPRVVHLIRQPAVGHVTSTLPSSPVDSVRPLISSQSRSTCSTPNQTLLFGERFIE